MAKYQVMLDAANGKVLFCGNKSAPLLENHNLFSGLFYRAQEEIILPPNSKVHTNVEIMKDGEKFRKTKATAITEPFFISTTNYWAARTCSLVHNGNFMTEFINCTDIGVKIPAGEVIGHVELVDDEYMATNATDV